MVSDDCTPGVCTDRICRVHTALGCFHTNQHVNSTNQELFEKYLCNPRILKERVAATYPRKSEVFITLCCWLCSTRYTAVRIKNCFKNTSAIEVATMKITDYFRYDGKPSHATTKSTLSLSAKMNGIQRRTLVSP